jgi:D-alanyl-D-alanine carboxypeptidase
VLPDGTSAFDVDLPGLAGLDPRLLDALQRAAAAASADDVDVVVTSGWRSPAYQEQLLDDAVARYGSAREAARWVALPTTSSHVSGRAVDIGSWDATAWFSEQGAEYDLCQIYANESWHYELRDGASTNGCPPMYRDAGEDPRMRS